MSFMQFLFVLAINGFVSTMITLSWQYILTKRSLRVMKHYEVKPETHSWNGTRHNETTVSHP